MASRFCKLGIIGWPLGYSLSPVMQEAALRSVGLEGEYKEHPVKPEDLELWLKNEGSKFAGFNVTMPYKKTVFNWLAENGSNRFGQPELLEDRILAVNTVVVKEGELIGYNTDGKGFLKPLADRRLNLTGWHVVLLGSGGAASAIAVALARETEVSRLTIWNRSERLDRANLLAKKVNRLRGGAPFAVGTDDIQSFQMKDVNLLINATPVGMAGQGDFVFAAEKLSPDLVVYDLVYQPLKTELIQIAKRRGCQVITGDEMLAAQGAVAFELFVDEPGISKKVYSVMRKALEEHFAAHS